MTQRRQTSDAGTVHSVRASEKLWAAARERARDEGVTMSFVITEILEGYARGLVDLPQVTKAYGTSRSAEERTQTLVA